MKRADPPLEKTSKGRLYICVYKEDIPKNALICCLMLTFQFHTKKETLQYKHKQMLLKRDPGIERLPKQFSVRI